MRDLKRHRGIKDLEGKEPVGVVLSAGIKGPRGQPIEKDYFHLLTPDPVQENRGGRKVLVRHHHPWFKAFNTAAPEQRRTVIGQIVHRTEPECFSYRLQAYQIQGQPMHPRKLPFCTGDGVQATRYRGVDKDGEHRFEDIACPHDRCEFRQRPRTSRGLGPPGCKPWGKLIFRLGWRGGSMPSMLCKWTTGGWNSVQSGLGFFDEIQRQAEMVLGARDVNLGGFLFTLTLGEKTNPEEGTRFPIVTFAPLSDPIEFFMAQVDRHQKLEGAYGLPALPAPDQTVSVLDETDDDDAKDFLAHMPGVGVPTEGDDADL
jgi:hypothetical protein